MPASLIVSALGLSAGGFAAAAVTFGVRVVTTLAISSLLAKQQDPGDQGDIGASGGRVQLAPATENKLPVIYGSSYASPIITDAKISTDQQTMWYVLSFSEATDTGTVTFGDVYWDDKILLFDPANPSEIEGWYNPNDDTRVFGVAGKISMWFYRNGSATPTGHLCRGLAGTGNIVAASDVDARTVLQDAGIPSATRWTNNDTMSNTVFAVMRVRYDGDRGITGLGTIRAQVINTLGNTSGATNGTGPGSVIKDYLMNDRYGCGIPLGNIDLTSLAVLDETAYNDGAFTLTDTDGDTVTNTYRYKINGPIDTTKDCLSNLNTIGECCDSWIQWNELTGKWGVVVNQSLEENGGSTSTMTVITANNLIGGINVTPIDLSSMGNAIRINFPNELLTDQTDFRYYELDAEDISPNEPNNEINFSLPLVTNSIQATWLGYKRLWSSRSDIVINFTMDYSGIRIDAGDVIAVNHEWYGWSSKQYGNGFYPGKPFRVTQVREFKDADGFLAVQISALEYNDDIYLTTNPHFFSPVSFSGISDPSFISPPGRPVVSLPSGNTGTSFIVSSTIPAVGNVLALEYWYSNTEAVTGNNYTLYGTQQNADASLYTNGVAETLSILNLPSGVYFWRTKAVGEQSNSDFSPASLPINWTLSGGPVSGFDILDNSIGGSKIISGDPATTGKPGSPGFFDTLGAVALPALGLAAMWAINEYGTDLFGKDQKPEGGGRETGNTDPYVDFRLDTAQAQVGDTVTAFVSVNKGGGDLSDWINFG